MKEKKDTFSIKIQLTSGKIIELPFEDFAGAEYSFNNLSKSLKDSSSCFELLDKNKARWTLQKQHVVSLVLDNLEK